MTTSPAQIQRIRDLAFQLYAELADFQTLLSVPDVPMAPARVRFDAPVGTAEERAAAQLWPGHWVDANPYLSRYNTTGQWAIHTGCDLNLNFPHWNADAHAPVYAPADGVVVVADLLPVWGKVIVIEVTLEDGSKRWPRLAHLEKFIAVKGQMVQRGTLLGAVGNAEGRYAWHLHYDIGKVDLGVKPTDWPGDDVAAVKARYEDPLAFTRERHGP